MKKTLLLLGNLLVHPVKTVKSSDLLAYSKSLLYVLGFLLLWITVFPFFVTLPNPTTVTYASALFAVLISLWILPLLIPLPYFIVLKLAGVKIKYRTARQLYLPCIILNMLFSAAHSIFISCFSLQTKFPIYGLLITLWFASITFLFCKYKFNLPERKCWIVFFVILILEVLWIIIFSLL